MYEQVEDFCISRQPPTVPLTQVLRYAVFVKFQNPRKVGTLCIVLVLGEGLKSPPKIHFNRQWGKGGILSKERKIDCKKRERKGEIQIIGQDLINVIPNKSF